MDSDQDRLAELVGEVERLRGLLARLEWAGGDPLRRYCPACSGYQPSSEADGAPGPFGHEPACWLAKELQQ